MLDNLKIIRDLKPGSVFLAQDREGEQWVLKKSPHTPQIVEFSQLVHRQGGDLAEIMPKYLSQGEYLCQKFLTWQLAGDTVQTYGIEDSSFEHIDAEKLGRALGELQKMSFARSQLEVRGAGFYLANTFEFKPAITQEYNPDFAQKVEDFLSGKSDLVDKYSHFLCNGDIHPQNIMYQDKNFMVVDWDLVQFNNPAWDLVAPYVWGWRKREWGEKMLAAYKETLELPVDDFEKIFAFDVVYLTSQLIKHAKLIDLPREFLSAQKKILEEHLG